MKTVRKCCKCSEHNVSSRYVEKGKLLQCGKRDHVYDDFTEGVQCSSRDHEDVIAKIEHLVNTCRVCGYSWKEKIKEVN